MPTLIWGGKEKVVNHHHDVPLRTLRHKYAFTAPEGTPANSSGNKIIHGDNLEALKALLPEYEGRVKCIYIDPPYNTGNEGWVYNDNVNDPKIRKWLGQVVGKEGEDLSRHDKWLCMMYPRLKLLRRLLTYDGVIFISIDENESAFLKCVLDEIFGGSNFIAQLSVLNNPKGRVMDKQIATNHEYCFIYSKTQLPKNSLSIKKSNEKVEKDFPLFDSLGKYRLLELRNTHREFGKHNRPNLFYPYFVNSKTLEISLSRMPNHIEVLPIWEDGFEGCWTWGKDLAKKELSLLVAKRSNGKIKIYRKGYAEKNGEAATRKLNSILIDKEFYTEKGQQVLSELFQQGKELFPSPKPVEFIKTLIEAASQRDSIILDSFAGSGTTGHAVLKLNTEDGGNRKLILIETMHYAETITAERVRRVMSGYGENSKAVTGSGGQFDFYEMGEPVFTEDGGLNTQLDVDELRRYIAFTENIPAASQISTDDPRSPYLLGIIDDTAYFFYYELEQTTTLDLEFLGALSFKPSAMIVYADNCLLDDAFLQRHNIIFKKIARDVMRY